MWYSGIKDKVFTQVSYMVKKTYPKLICTTVNENTIPSKFPTMYLHELQPAEAGNDLTNETVNAVICTIEVMVWTNTTETDCRQICDCITEEFKRLQFNVTMMPLVEMRNNIASGVIRFRRIVGNGDLLAK